MAENQMGPGGVYANGQFEEDASHWWPSHSAYCTPATVFTAPVNGEISQFSGIFGGYYWVSYNYYDCDSSRFGSFKYALHFWPSPQAYLNEPEMGTYIEFNGPSNPDYQTTVGYIQGGSTIYKKYRIVLDMADAINPMSFPVQANQQYVISVNAAPVGTENCHLTFSSSTGAGFGSEIDLDRVLKPPNINYGPNYLDILGKPYNQFASRVIISK